VTALFNRHSPESANIKKCAARFSPSLDWAFSLRKFGAQRSTQLGGFEECSERPLRLDRGGSFQAPRLSRLRVEGDPQTTTPPFRDAPIDRILTNRLLMA
jgi:hypothetical protein